MMLRFLENLDRRWIFLVMLLAVAVPMLLQVTFPEEPSPMVERVFETVNELPAGSRVWMALDYDPGSKGELNPMAEAFTRHCARKGHRIYFMTLWPQGVPMIQQMTDILRREYPELKYGRDYVNLGYQPGSEAVIKVLVSGFEEQFVADVNGTPIKDIPMMSEISNLQQVDLLVNVSAGSPGTKEWVQYASTPYAMPTVAGCTGVQAPSLYPYVPQPLIGLLGAIKAAAEYERLLILTYPEFDENVAAKSALRRMGPQNVAHVTIVLLILLGNAIFFLQRGRR